jgi:hypothetical protein
MDKAVRRLGGKRMNFPRVTEKSPRQHLTGDGKKARGSTNAHPGKPLIYPANRGAARNVIFAPKSS